MNTIPRSISRREAARALAVCEKTVAALLNLPFTESERINLRSLAKATQSDPAWILDCIEGRDSAVSQLQANALKGGTGHLRPKASLRRGDRYSALELGLIQVSPLAGRPDGFTLTEAGWVEG